MGGAVRILGRGFKESMGAPGGSPLPRAAPGIGVGKGSPIPGTPPLSPRRAPGSVPAPGPPGPPRSRPDPAAPGGRSIPGDAELGESPAGSRSRSRGGIWGKSHPAAPGRGNAGPEGAQGVGNCSRRAFPGREFPRSGIASRDLWGFRDPGVWSFPAKLEDGGARIGIRGDIKRLFQGMGAALSLGRARDAQQNFKNCEFLCRGALWLLALRDPGSGMSLAE